jgi:hypothetical protein
MTIETRPLNISGEHVQIGDGLTIPLPVSVCAGAIRQCDANGHQAERRPNAFGSGVIRSRRVAAGAGCIGIMPYSGHTLAVLCSEVLSS